MKAISELPSGYDRTREAGEVMTGEDYMQVLDKYLPVASSPLSGSITPKWLEGHIYTHE